MNIQTLTSKMSRTPEFSMMSMEQLESIGNAVLNGKMIDAIGLYRNYTGMGLADAKAAVDRCFALAAETTEEPVTVCRPEPMVAAEEASSAKVPEASVESHCVVDTQTVPHADEKQPEHIEEPQTTAEPPKSTSDKVMSVLDNKKLMGLITACVCVVVLFATIGYMALTDDSSNSNEDNDYTYSNTDPTLNSTVVSSSTNTASNSSVTSSSQNSHVIYPTVNEYMAKLREKELFPNAKIDVAVHSNEVYSFVLEDIIAVELALNSDGTVKGVVAAIYNIDWMNNTETTAKAVMLLNNVVYPLIGHTYGDKYSRSDFLDDAVNPDYTTQKGSEDFAVNFDIGVGTYGCFSDRASRSISSGFYYYFKG